MLENFWHGCGHCHGPESCALADALEKTAISGRPFSRGTPLVVTSITVFVLPLVLALVVSTTGGRWSVAVGRSLALGQILGAAAGLAAGVAVAKLIVGALVWRARLSTGVRE